MFKVKFWGVRGSIPCPGPETSRYGGNTSCIQIKTDKDYEIIIDCGSGVRELGASFMKDPLVKKPFNIYIFLSHTHWDHIMGLPFFTPIYIPGSDITIHGPVTFEDEPIDKIVGGQLTYRYFPVRQDELSSDLKFKALKEGSMELPGGIKVSYIYLNHPIMCLGYRFEYEGKVFATCYDHEPFINLFEFDPDNIEEGRIVAEESNKKVTDIYKDADLLVHDSQYTTKEYENFKGWGHSTYKYAITQAISANVKNLALFHHDPNRTDKQLDQVKDTMKQAYGSSGINIFPAYEGLEIEL